MSASETPAAVLIWAPLERSCAASRAWLRFHSLTARLSEMTFHQVSMLQVVVQQPKCEPVLQAAGTAVKSTWPACPPAAAPGSPQQLAGSVLSNKARQSHLA